MTISEFKLPLLEVRPECAGLLRNMPVTEAPITPPNNSPSPYFSDNVDPEKYLKAGKSCHLLLTLLILTISAATMIDLSQLSIEVFKFTSLLIKNYNQFLFSIFLSRRATALW